MKSYLIILLLFCLTLISCGGDDEYSPKPRGYFRIDLPKKTYQLYDKDCPFTFEYPKYARIVADNERLAEPCWLNFEFPHFGAILHLSYKELNHGPDEYIKYCWELAQKHIAKASGMNNVEVFNKQEKVYGLVFNIEGNAASPLQFYVTDSVKHFLRGSLYFNAVPNRDSIGPVFEFIHTDIERMIKTLHWKNTPLPKMPVLTETPKTDK
jgi:gliding motility-associated lipoprotein GldD